MPTTKASRAQQVRPGYWLVIASEAKEDPWRRRIEQDPRLVGLGHVEFLAAPVRLYVEYQAGRTALYKSFFRNVQRVVNSQEGISPSEWKVVIGFTHGDAQGGVTMHPDPEDEEEHWGFASQWWTPFYFAGVRRLHYHTCHVGSAFMDKAQFPLVLKRGAESEGENITITAWRSKIGQYDETFDQCAPNDEYIFRGMPLCRAMDVAQGRGYNSLVQLRVCVTPDGVLVRHRMQPTTRRH